MIEQTGSVDDKMFLAYDDVESVTIQNCELIASSGEAYGSYPGYYTSAYIWFGNNEEFEKLGGPIIQEQDWFRMHWFATQNVLHCLRSHALRGGNVTYVSLVYVRTLCYVATQPMYVLCSVISHAVRRGNVTYAMCIVLCVRMQ